MAWNCRNTALATLVVLLNAADPACGVECAAPAGNAHFWLSPLPDGATFGEVPLINTLGDGVLYLWGRPAAGETLQALSFNVETPSSAPLRFTGGQLDNPSLGVYEGKPSYRFEFAPAPPEDQIAVRQIRSLQGFSVAQRDRLGRGIGPNTRQLDPLYDEATDSWRIGQVAYFTDPHGGVASLFLQVGKNGMLGVDRWGQPTSDFNVVFGDALDDPICAGRERNLSSQFEDARVTDGSIVASGEEFVSGTYWQGPGAALTMGIDSPSPGFGHDQLVAGGLVHLDGQLHLLSNGNGGGYQDPQFSGAFDVFELITSQQAVVGRFDEITYDGVQLNADFEGSDGALRSHQGQGLFRVVGYRPNAVVLWNYRALVGDANGDRRVDFLDFLLLSSHFSHSGNWPDGDFSGDGTVDFDDMLLFQGSFGISLGRGLAQPVPEPGCFAASLLLAVWLTHARPRRGIIRDRR